MDINNLEEWTSWYAESFRICFSYEYSMKYMKRFSENRFQRLVEDQDIELTDREFKKYQKIFVKTFIDKIVNMIEEDRKNLKSKKDKE